jgi:predicted Rossmann fold flavoprotein
MFRVFQAKDTVEWFEERGVHLKVEEDGRMFPVTDDSQTIIDCFFRQAGLLKIAIETGDGVEHISFEKNLFHVRTTHQREFISRKILVTTGGHPKPEAYSMIGDAGHKIISIIPSLFTFNDSEKKFTDLMGVAVTDAGVKIAGSDLSQRGPVLITHWGLSGPAILKLSAWAAILLHSLAYEFTVLINWSGVQTEESIRSYLNLQRNENGNRKILNYPAFSIPQRLWDRLLTLAEIPKSKIWSEATNKDINRLIELIFRCPFRISGKTTFKEEFVSCGGVDLQEVDLQTMESKIIPGLYFAGEVLNIDGETGGFNFQSAWTTAFIAAKAIGSEF